MLWGSLYDKVKLLLRMYHCTSWTRSWFLLLKSCTIQLLPVTVVAVVRLLRHTISEETFQNVSRCTACFLHQNPAFMLPAVLCRQQLMTLKELYHALLHGQKTSAVWKEIKQKHSRSNAEVFKGVLYTSWTQVPLCDRSLKKIEYHRNPIPQTLQHNLQCAKAPKMRCVQKSEA